MATPETAPASRTPEAESVNEREVQAIIDGLDFSKIDEMRNRQRQAYMDAEFEATTNGASIEEARQAAERAATSTKDGFVNELFQHQTALDHGEAVYDFVSKYAYDQMSDDEWYSAERDNTGEVTRASGISQIKHEVKELRRTLDPEGAALADMSDEDRETYEDWQDELNLLRDRVATLNAKRQSKLWGRGGEKYEEALGLYNDHVIAMGRMQHEELLNDDEIGDTQKNATVIDYLLQEQQKLRELTLEKFEGTHVSKLVNWLRSGSRAQRFWKGALIGGSAGIIGAGAGLALGAVGAGVIAGGVSAGVLAASRFARAYAVGDSLQGRGMKKEVDASGYNGYVALEKEGDTDHFDAANRFLNEKLETDTKKEQNKRRKSIALGMAGVALGAGLVYSAQVVADVAADSGAFDAAAKNLESFGQDAQKFAEEVPGNVDSFMEDVKENGQDASRDIEAMFPEIGDADGSHVDTTVEAPATPEMADFDPNFAIGYGEGGIQFFERLGLSEADWYSVHHELRDNFPGDFYNDGGDTRLSHPGQLSVEAQQFIKTRFGL